MFSMLALDLVSADNYKVRENKIVEKMVATKIWLSMDEKKAEQREQINRERQKYQTLTDQQMYHINLK